MPGKKHLRGAGKKEQLIIALGTAVLGFTGIAVASARISKGLFFLFLVFCVIFFVYGSRQHWLKLQRRSRQPRIRQQGTAVTETTTTTDTSGTITEYTPGSTYFMLRAGTTGAPARFDYTNDAHVFDPEGHPLGWPVLRPDVPAKVYYIRQGNQMIVRKVVVSKAAVVEKETTTTVTTQKP